MSSLQDDTLFAKDAERSIVAALFSDSETSAEAFDRLNVLIKAEDFYFGDHRLVFNAFAELVELDQRPDPVVLATYLKSLPSYTESVRQSIVDATSTAYAIENIEAYGQAVLEKSKARRIRKSLDDLSKKTARVGGGISAKDILREVDAVSMEFDDSSTDIELLQPTTHLLAKTVERLTAIDSGGVAGASYGIDKLDERLGMMMPGDLVIVAGRPGMGKSVFAQNALLKNCVNGPAPAGVATEDLPGLGVIFSLEMGTEKLGFRMLSSIGQINHDHLRKAKLDDQEWTRLTHAINKYESSDIRADTDATLTPAIMRSKLRMLVRKTKRKLSLIVVDYLQLMDVDRKGGGENRNAEITVISRNLKKLAKEFQCPVMALSQLNRGVEQRADKRPLMSDLRESGAIEQDADVIILLYRDEYYNPDSDAVGIAEINAAKARDGGVGIVPAQFIGEYQQFRDLNTNAHSYDGKYGDEK